MMSRFERFIENYLIYFQNCWILFFTWCNIEGKETENEKNRQEEMEQNE